MIENEKKEKREKFTHSAGEKNPRIVDAKIVYSIF
jgi:hypothetical protein